jgi:hypothetical protein
MKNKLIFLLLIFICSTIFIRAEVVTSTIYPHFQSLEANTFEPRVGTLVQTNSKKLRLDIGSDINIYNFHFILCGTNFHSTINSEFMTYTRLRSQSNFKFPVETADYYFGLNYTFKTPLNQSDNLQARFRIAHISSHIVDGYLKDTNTLSVNPFVYSREFLDVTFAWEKFYMAEYGIRLYLGCNSVFSRKPKDANIFVPNAGFDGFYYFGSIANIDMEFRYGYDFKLVGFNDVYTGVNSFQAGLKFNFPNTAFTKGIGLNYYLYDGKSIHGMFYNERDSYSAIGFQIYY